MLLQQASRIALVITALSVFTSGDAFAAGTIYIAKHGNDANACTRTAPCASIQTGIDRADARGRVMVGPGIYREAVTVDTSPQRTGIRVTSTHGAAVTVIDSNGLTNENALLSEGNIVGLVGNGIIFGQKGRGFTLRDNAKSGAVVFGDRIRFEGNTLEVPNARFGLLMFGGNQTVRYNRVSGANIAFSLRSDRGNRAGANWLVDENTAIDSGLGFEFLNGRENHRLRNLNNRSEGFGFGFDIWNFQNTDGTTVPRQNSSGDRHANLVIDGATSAGSGLFLVEGGNPTIENLSIRTTHPAAVGLELIGTNGASIRNFSGLSERGQFDAGAIVLDKTVGTSIERSSTQGWTHGITLRNSSGLRARRNNFLISALCALNVEGSESENLRFVNNFWAFEALPLLPCSPEIEGLVASGEASFQPASQQN